MLLLEDLYRANGTCRDRVPADSSWETTQLPPEILSLAGIPTDAERNFDSFRPIEDAGERARRAISGLMDTGLPDWKRARACATLSLIAERDKNKLTRALATNALVDHAKRADLASSPAPGRSKVIEKGTREGWLATLHAARADSPPADSTVESVLSDIEKQTLDDIDTARALTFLLSDVARLHSDGTIEDLASTVGIRVSLRLTILVLYQGLEDENAIVREDAVRGFLELRSFEAVPLLLERLESDSSITVRRAAAVALGTLGSDAVIESLIRVLDRPEEDTSVVLSALTSLRKLTRTNCGLSAARWRHWWSQVQSLDSQGSGQPRGEPRGPYPPETGATR